VRSPSARVTLYGFWEHTFFFDRTGRDPWSDVVGLGLHIVSHPFASVSFFADFGQGYRWLGVHMGGVPPPTLPPNLLQMEGQRVTYPTPSIVTWSYRGWEFGRAALGASFALTRRARLELAVTASAGVFTNFDEGCSSCASNIPTAGRTVHGFGGITVGTHWDVVR
jgi:hypothetical protein